ncbi:phosphoribosylglycinamide formyltransferase [Neobacillus sp. PS3-12]|jgi:phosphoribosylglycinamide formyltransferase 1|uniref:phosphoribosylglycinamide formyltransferase n=1 Tax=Neobacillus sp. PS3-12 TaxID=3070677 RepID=UPI0027E030BA|nr:phosphoribosylglycinamide formyltransferase [Neobacillus sp. PS3-12]WML50850.1 phosphoribosylglycinamide formyltransferase [Neobacillus sp. PS3-12]
MKSIAIFASGSGSNFQAIIDAIQEGKLDAQVNLLVCDQPNAFVIERAKNAGIPSFVFQAKQYKSKEAYETEIIEELNKRDVEFVVLAGYMRLIGPGFLNEYQGRIVNIHPSLLPAFPGKDAIGQAIRAGVKESGVTVHFVDEGMDTGPMIAQEAVSIDVNDTSESLQPKIHAIEHKLYPAVLQRLFSQGGNKNDEKARTY